MTQYENYLIKKRVVADIKQYGSVGNTIEHLNKELKEMESLWSMFSCDSLGHGIICTELKLSYLKKGKKQ